MCINVKVDIIDNIGYLVVPDDVGYPFSTRPMEAIISRLQKGSWHI